MPPQSLVRPETEELSVDLSGLSAVLWRERDILENLLFRLDVQQMLLMSGRDAWLVRASKAAADSPPSLGALLLVGYCGWAATWTMLRNIPL